MRNIHLFLPALLLGCESLVGSQLTVDVSDATASDYSEDAPGVVYVEDRGTFVPILVLCGQTPDEAETYHESGFGCLEDGLEGTSEPFRATIRPVSADLDVGEFCAIGLPEGLNRGLNLTDEWFDPDPARVEEPGSDWPVVDGTATWRGDGFSGCGGTLSGEVEI